MKTVRVLTVCLGNICRSPAAQGILQAAAEKTKTVELFLDSAGTAAYHVGNPPDSRSIQALQDIGINIAAQKARKVSTQDFYDNDWILAMDQQNLSDLQAIQPSDGRANVVMFGDFSPNVNFGEVADPYYGKDKEFVVMREQLQRISHAFLEHIANE
ncbi:low molecular weight protein-tyrosine-phosphatase [Marinomonas epiphytica]